MKRDREQIDKGPTAETIGVVIEGLRSIAAAVRNAHDGGTAFWTGALAEDLAKMADMLAGGEVPVESPGDEIDQLVDRLRNVGPRSSVRYVCRRAAHVIAELRRDRVSAIEDAPADPTRKMGRGPTAELRNILQGFIGRIPEGWWLADQVRQFLGRLEAHECGGPMAGDGSAHRAIAETKAGPQPSGE